MERKIQRIFIPCLNETITVGPGGDYTMDEFRILVEHARSMSQAEREDYFKKIHMVKRTFPGSTIEKEATNAKRR